MLTTRPHPDFTIAGPSSRLPARCSMARAYHGSPPVLMHLSDLDATAQAELVRRGDASPRELVDAAILRIEKHNPELGAVIIPLFDQARATADNAPHGP